MGDWGVWGYENIGQFERLSFPCWHFCPRKSRKTRKFTASFLFLWKHRIAWSPVKNIFVLFVSLVDNFYGGFIVVNVNYFWHSMKDALICLLLDIKPPLGGCPRIETLLRKNPFWSFFPNIFVKERNYSPQMFEKTDSKRLSLATASILGQPPSWNICALSAG